MRLFRRIALLAVPILAVVGVAAAVSIPAQPASAISSVRLFEAFGSYALGAPNLSGGASVTETISGRDVMVSPQSGTSVKIVFTANTHLCANAQDGTENILVGSCSGNGSLWTIVGASCSECFKFKNNRESSLLGQDVWMYGANNGSPLYWAITSAPGYKVWQETNP